MKALAAAAAAVLLLTACGTDQEVTDGRRQYRKVKGTLVAAPPGVTGRPVCVEDKITGGTYGKDRYEVTLDLSDLRGPARPVFYSVFLTAGEKSFPGYVTGQKSRPIKGRTASLLPPDTFGDLKTAVVQPADRIGVLQILPDLTKCEVRISEPTPFEQKAGGRGLATVTRDEIVMSPGGVERPISER